MQQKRGFWSSVMSVVGPKKHSQQDPKNSSKKSMGTDEKIWYFQLFRYSTLRDRIFIVIATICSAICGGIQPYLMLAFGDVTGVIVDYAANLNDSLSQEDRGRLEDNLFEGINRFALNCSLCGLATIISTYVAGVLFSYSALRQIYHIRKLLLKKVLNQDMAWYDLNKTGEFASIFTENLSKVEEGIGEKLGTFIYFETIFVVGIVMALVMGWKLALVCMVSLPVSTLLIGLISWLSTKFAQQELEAYGAAGAIAEEVLSSIRTVVAFNGQDKEFERYDEHLQFVKKNNIKKSMFTGISNGLMWFFVYASYALSFWYGVGLILEERDLPESKRVYTPANMVAVFFCTLIASWHFGSGTPYFEIFGTACGAAKKIFDVLDSEPVINLSKDEGEQPKEINGEIALENVFFQYPSRTDVEVLQGININIKSGETVALVGNSGCGKSTCIQLIQRFYDTASGRVLIDNYNIKDLNLTWLRNQISVVGQEPALFATTIAENIKFGNFKATQSEIEAAAKKANAHSFIRNLPHGYQTVIGERGAQLSGGQKQRIAIARALIKHPKILLLDEATSALDSTSEAEVQAALDSISGVCTTIIVAHRLSTIRNANRILVLSEGRVVEEGTHNELMQKRAVYYGLVKSQGLEDAKETDEGQLTKSTANNVVEKANGVAFQNHVEEDVVQLDVEEKTSGVVFEILKMNKPEWFFILIGCISSIITGASLPVYGVVFGDIIGVLADRDAGYVREQSNLFSLYFVIIGIVSAAAHFIMMYTFSVAGEKLTSRIRRKMFHCMLHEEMGWFDRKENGVGSLCAKLSSEAASVQGAAGIRIGTILNSLSTFIIANTIALYFNWKLALVLISFSPLILISVFFEQKFTQADAQKNQKYLENSAKIAVEAIGNIKTVASLNCENFFLNKYIQELKPYLVNSKKKGHFMAVTMGVARSIMFFAYVAAMVYGSILIVETGIPYATVFIVSETVIVGSWSIGNAFSFSPNLQKGLSSAQRIFRLLSRTPKVRNLHNAKIYEKVKGNVDYENVYFSYPNRPNTQILNGLFLAVLQQKTIALCGPSGCGKSTVVQLLERFYDPTGGRVALDGENIKEIDIYNLRSHMSIVSQEPNLFNATIKENIAYGDNSRKVPMNEIIEAAKQANIHNFVVSLPQGYETNLGNKGTQLSGGQKQRIAIARALIRNPKILLLDEATSALDHENEKIVQESLDNAKKNRTCIIIAHRLTTVQDADVICVLNEGVIREMGTHSELLDMKGLYYNYYKLQTLSQ